MVYLLCRNRVADFEIWKRVFVSHTPAHRAAGLDLLHLWRSIDEPNNVFFLFEVQDQAKAQAFIGSAEAAAAGKESGVIDGDVHFLEAHPGY